MPRALLLCLTIVAAFPHHPAAAASLTDAVQAPGRLVVGAFELPARVQDGKDHLERALVGLRVLVDGDATAVVGDRDRRSVLVQRHGDGRGEAIHRFVDGVVEDFPDQMMEPGAADAADIHARPLPDGIQAFKDSDVFG